MNKIIINILLFSALVIGSIGLITFDVWADTTTTDVYEIPEDYESKNVIIQYRKQTASSSVQQVYSDFMYDFTIYYPKNYVASPYLYIYNDKYNINFAFANGEKSNLWSSYAFDRFDINGVACYKDSDGEAFYLKKNLFTQHITTLPLSGSSITPSEQEKSISLTSFDGLSASNETITFNIPIILSNYNKETKIYNGILKSDYIIKDYGAYDISKFCYNVISFTDDFIKSNSQAIFPEPTLKFSRKVSNSTIQVFYDYPQKVPTFKYVYPKVYVKVNGEDWQEYQEYNSEGDALSQHIFKFNVDNTNQNIWGALSLTALYIRMGYTYNQILSEDFEPPKIQGIIWGVQYGYAMTQNIGSENSIRKSKIVFSRYVFEDNIINTPDVGIGDLGDLPNISGSNSSIEVGSGSSSGSGSNIGSSGSHVVPAPSDSADYSDVGSFFKSLNFDFSSIGKALSGSFSLVTGFASMIGNIFQNFFGEAVGIIALLAIGICIVLRVLGR